MSKLQWPHLKDFMAAKRVPLYPPTGRAKKATGAFYQEFMNLKFFWILKAGHMVSKQASLYRLLQGFGLYIVLHGVLVFGGTMSMVEIYYTPNILSILNIARGTKSITNKGFQGCYIESYYILHMVVIVYIDISVHSSYYTAVNKWYLLLKVPSDAGEMALSMLEQVIGVNLSSKKELH